MALAEFLRAEIQKEGISNAEFARRVDIKPTELSRILNKTFSKKTPSDTILTKLSIGLNIEKAELIKKCYEKDSSFSSQTKPLSTTTELLYGTYPMLSETRQIIEKTETPKSPFEFAKELLENDNGKYKLNIGNEEQWAEIYRNYPDTALFFYDKEIERIVGDCSFITLTNKQIHDLENKEIESIKDQQDIKNCFEKELLVQTAPPITFPGTYAIFLLNMGFIDSHNTITNNRLMVDTFIEHLETMKQNDVIINKIFIRLFNDVEKNFFKLMGFKQQKLSEQIYFLDYPNALKWKNKGESTYE